MAFQIGDKVVYPNHGIGVVEDIQSDEIEPTKEHRFYKLRILANSTVVKVPIANVEGVGVRRVISNKDVARIFDLLENRKIETHSNWKGRYKDNSDKMRSGSIYDVAGVLQDLSSLSKKKSLSFREKRMLDRARFLIVSEVAEVAAEPQDLVEQKIPWPPWPKTVVVRALLANLSRAPRRKSNKAKDKSSQFLFPSIATARSLG